MMTLKISVANCNLAIMINMSCGLRIKKPKRHGLIFMRLACP